MSESNRKIITDAITRMLARREHSIVEIRQKLAAKEIAEQQSAPIIAEFVNADIQSDLRFTEAKIRSLFQRGAGPTRIRLELLQHNISEEMINAAIEHAEIDWFAAALAVREKKFGLSPLMDFKQRQKQMQFLRYRGFTQSQIQYAINGE